MKFKLIFRIFIFLIFAATLFVSSASRMVSQASPLAQDAKPQAVGGAAPLNVIFDQNTSSQYVSKVYTSLTANPDLSPFRLNTHWSVASTANKSGGSGQGDALLLTWSIIPDGTLMPSQFTGDTTCNSNLIARMNAVYGSGTWQAELTKVFAEWSSRTGNKYTQVTDDGAAWHSSPGVTGKRGDIRIGGCRIDGNSNVLAYNFFPSDGDMKIDATDSFFTASILQTGFHNVVAHEHGHGDGLSHVCPVNQTKLMEPFVSFAFTGLQHDDIRGGQRQYGDYKELVGNPNDSAAGATNLGTPALGTPVNVNGVSIDDNSDQDWFRFTVAANAKLNASISPVGSTYLEGPQNADGSCSAGVNLNSLAVHNLGFEVRDSNGTTLLTTRNVNGAGLAEALSNFALGAAGTKYIRVFGGTTDNIQLYNLQLTVNPGATTGFNSEFNGSAPDWLIDAGAWSVDANFLTSVGLANKWATVHQVGTYNNFDFETKVWRNGCDSCSNVVFFRGTPAPLDATKAWNKGYLVTFNRGRQYAVWSTNNGSVTQLKAWTTTTSLNAGSTWNVVRIVASGSSLKLYFNGVLVWSGTNTVHTTGKIGFGMFQDGTSGNQIWFDYAKLTSTAALSLEPAEVSSEQQELNRDGAATGDVTRSGSSVENAFTNATPPLATDLVATLDAAGVEVSSDEVTDEVAPQEQANDPGATELNQHLYLPLIQSAENNQ